MADDKSADAVLAKVLDAAQRAVTHKHFPCVATTAVVGALLLRGLWRAGAAAGGKRIEDDEGAVRVLRACAAKTGLDVAGGSVRKTSSRFCLGVEHGDYNGTELFGVGTDRFIWMAYKPNGRGEIRLFSDTFSDEGVLTIPLGKDAKLPPPKSSELAHSWARFPFGVVHVLKEAGLAPVVGFDAVLCANIPGGGMSRSASLTLNLLLTCLDVNAQAPQYPFQMVDLAQRVENEYIGSPCGNLDQIMIYFAKAGMGTHYKPATREVSYVPLGGNAAADLRFVSLDTGTVRPGLEKSTYAVRKAECDKLVVKLKCAGHAVKALGDVRTDAEYERILATVGKKEPALCDRLTYIFGAQKRFYDLMQAWKSGDLDTVGRIFRRDGHGLRDEYKISGPELESMCDLVRTVPGVLGERMLGGGDKGAAGALVRASAVEAVKRTVTLGYPRCHPDFADKYAVHVCKLVDGVTVLQGLL